MSNTPAIKNPGPFEIPSGLKTTLGAFAVIGVLTFAISLKLDPVRAWASFVQNHFFFLSLALGGLFLAALQWITGAMWSAPLRRLMESFTAYLPVVFVTFAILYFGIPYLYLWSHADHVKGDLVLEGKSGYLSTGFFAIRNVIAVGIWVLFARKMVGNSIAQDKSRDYGLSVKNRILAPAFIALYAVSFT
ncbi:MAG: hypothetical protein ABIQ95_03335, partial [Bdellovibrionia bacterium]